MGGVLAMLAAVEIKLHSGFLGPIVLYTYGQPRVGNVRFADFIMDVFPNGEFSRVVHFTDPVVDVPSILFGFKHAGNEIWYFSPKSSDL